MVFFKYHIIAFVFLIKLLFIKSINDTLEFYQDKHINLKDNYYFKISSKKIKKDSQIIIIIEFNNDNVKIEKEKIKFFLNIDDDEKKKTKFTYSNNKIVYLNKKLTEKMDNEYYFIEFTSLSENDNFVSFFLYDNQNELLIPEGNETFSKNFNLINIYNQNIIMNFKWNVSTSKYLRANWTSECDDITLKINESSIPGKNNYTIIEYNNEKLPFYFKITNNCGGKKLKLNLDIVSNNTYDLKELINKIDFIYFNDLYYYMSVLYYDNNLMNYFKFEKNDSDNFEFKYILSNKNENELVDDIKNDSFNNFEYNQNSILGYKINETDCKYIILKITNLNSNYVSEIKTLNIYNETEIIPVDNFNQIALTNPGIYKILLDISSTNKYLFYIKKNFSINITMNTKNNSFKDFNTNLFYIDKNTTNSNDYFIISLYNYIDDNSIQIYNDKNDNYYIYNYNKTNINNFSGNFSSNQNLYFINIYDDESQNKVLYVNDYRENINIYYNFGSDLNLEKFINLNNERLNYPIIADKKFDLLSINCSSINCSYSIIYKRLYENNEYITITYNTLYEFFVLNNQPLKININNPNSIINSIFNAKLLPNLQIDLLKVFISMDNENEFQLNNNEYEDNSKNITKGNYLYLKSENGDSFITLKFSLPYYQINNCNAIEEKFNSQYNLFIIPELHPKEFINLIIFSNSNNINIFFEEKDNLDENLWKEPSNNYNNGTNKTFHITKESKKFIYIKIQNINNISDYKYHFKKMTYDNLSDLTHTNIKISDFLIYEYNDDHNNSKNGTIEFNFLKGHDILNLYLYDNLGDIQQISNGFRNEKNTSIDSFKLDTNDKKYYIVLCLNDKTEEKELYFYVFNQGKIYDLNISNTYNFYYQLINNNSKTITFKNQKEYNYITSKINDQSSMNNCLIFYNDESFNDSFILENNSEHFKYNNYSYITFKITNNNNDPNINIVNLNITFDFLNIQKIEEVGYNKDLNDSIFIINNNKTFEGITKVVTFFNLTEINYFEIENNDTQFVIKSYNKNYKNEKNDIYFNFNESIKYYIFKINKSENFSYSFYELKKSLDNLSNENIYKFNNEEEYLIYNFDNKLNENIMNIFFDENVIENHNLSILIYDSYESIRKKDENTFIDGEQYDLNYELNESINYSIVFIKKNLSMNQNFFINTKDYINLNSNEYNYTYYITYFYENITFHYFYKNNEKYKYFHYQFGNFINETSIYIQLKGGNNYESNDFFNTFNIESLEEFYIDFSINRNENDKNKLPFIFKINNDKEPDSNLYLLNENFNYNNDILTNRTINFNQNLKSYYNKEKIAFKLSNQNDLKIKCSYLFNSNDINVNNDFENCLFDMDSSSESYYYFENEISDDKKSEKDNAIIKIDIFNENMTVNTKKFEIKPYLKTIFYLNSDIKLYLDQFETKTYDISNITNDKFVILQTKKGEYLKYELFNNGNKLIKLYGETNNSLNLFEFINKSYKYFNYFDYETNSTSKFLEINNLNNTNISNYLIFLNQDKKYILYMDLIFGTPIMNYCHNFSNINYIINNIDCKNKLDSYFFIDKNSNQTLVQINSTLNNSFTYLNLIEIIENGDEYNLNFTLGEIYFITIQNKNAVINFINSNNYNIKDLNDLKIGLFSANKKNFNYNGNDDNLFIINNLTFINNSFQINISCTENNFLLIVKVGLVKSNLTVINSNDNGSIKKNVTIFELPYESQNNSCILTLKNEGEDDCIYLLYQLTDSEIYSLPNKNSKCINLLKNEQIKISIIDPLRKPIISDKKNYNFIRKFENTNNPSFYITLQTNKNSNIYYEFFLYEEKNNNNLKKYIPVLAIVVIIIIVVILIILYTIHINYKKKKILIFKDFFEGNKKKKKDKNLVLKTLTINSILPTNKNEDIDIDLDKESFDNMNKSIEKSIDNIN